MESKELFRNFSLIATIGFQKDVYKNEPFTILSYFEIVDKNAFKNSQEKLIIYINYNNKSIPLSAIYDSSEGDYKKYFITTFIDTACTINYYATMEI